MAKIGKLTAAKRQLDAAIRMFFKNEDITTVQEQYCTLTEGLAKHQQ